MIRRDKDLAFLMTFDNEPEIIQDYTGDLDLLMTAVRAQRAGGGTALNDAIYMASESWLTRRFRKVPKRRFAASIVVISDGHDNLSDRALSDAIDASIRSEAAVFTVSTNTDWLAIDDASKPSKYHLEAGDKVLQQFADQTGGHAFFPYRIDDLAQSFLTSAPNFAANISSPTRRPIRRPSGNIAQLTCRPPARASSSARAKAITAPPRLPPSPATRVGISLIAAD